MPKESLSIPDLDRLTAEQKTIADTVSAGPRGAIRGPVRMWLHSPGLADHAQKLGQFLRWETVLDPRISELVILVTARHYDCHYIWFNHVGIALKHGVSQDAVERIKTRKIVRLEREDESTAYEFTTALLCYNKVPDATLARAKVLFRERGVVEMGAIIAHYHSGAIVLALGDVPLPDGSKTCLP